MHAIVPVKFLKSGKSRLSPVINSQQREQLIYGFLERTLFELSKIHLIKHIEVVTSDKKIKKFLSNLGIGVIRKLGIQGLNKSVEIAYKQAIRQSAFKVLIIPIDLVYFSASDITKIISQVNQEEFVVLAPDNKLTGTNLILLNSSQRYKFMFGDRSLIKHLNLAQHLQIPVKIFYNKNITFDLDYPNDYTYFEKCYFRNNNRFVI